MYRLEFNEVMKAVGINNPLSTTNISGSIEEVHYWNNLAICFGGSYYAIINGRIPLEVANIIYEKYPNNPYGIRVNGGCFDWLPIEFAVDDKYERDTQSYLDQHLPADEYTTKCKNAERNLRRRKNDNKYLTTYHIDSKEGLLIFLTEMQDYYLRKNNMPETEVRKYDELIAKVTSEILKKVNPSISAYDWMQGSEKNKDSYNSSVERDSKTELGQMFRRVILGFDKAVNPFINDNVELDEIGNYIKKVRINASSYEYEDGEYREGCCCVEISDLRTGNRTTYYRRPNRFSFGLMYELGEGQLLDVTHYFSPNGNNESDKGEIIVINYFGDKPENNLDIRLNITNGKIGINYAEKIPVTSEQIGFVYDELLKAIGYASRVTIENMQKGQTLK